MPESIRDATPDTGLPYRKRMLDVGPRLFNQEANTYRMEFGATGTLDMLGADWEAYYTYQNFHQAQVTRNYINMLAVQNAFDVEAGAGIDVTTAEPPKKSHPYYQIINHSNFVWTPHTAWASEEALKASMDQLILNINEFYLGKPRNLV